MFIDKFLNFINQDDKDIFNFFTSLENRLYLTYYFEDIFNRNYIINFNDSNYFNKLLDIDEGTIYFNNKNQLRFQIFQFCPTRINVVIIVIVIIVVVFIVMLVFCIFV